MVMRVRDLSFSYADRSILQNIDLTIEANAFTVVLGKNGSGKSTLFRLLTGFLKPQSGEITIMGTPIGKMNDRKRAHLLGFLPQHHRPVFPFRVEDVVLTGRVSHTWLSPGKEDYNQVRKAMERIGIEHLKGRTFTELSGGEQQLVMIARILAQNPRIILFDEPTSHLDFFYQAKVLNIIRDLVRQNYTVMAILHDPNIAALYGDRFICLKHGKILSQIEPCHLNAQLLEEVYEMPLKAMFFKDKMIVLPTGK
ncbi:MAG: ABC transporter ATP-binding protein [Desulfobacteraceae bacterium]|jgi:iron complex transport system ATP-binding protein